MNTIQASAPAPAELAPPTTSVDSTLDTSAFGAKTSELDELFAFMDESSQKSDFDAPLFDDNEFENGPELSEERAKILGGPEIAEEFEVSYVDGATTPSPETEESRLTFDYVPLPNNRYYLNIGNYGIVTSINPEYFTSPEGLEGNYVTLPVDVFDQLPIGEYIIGESDGFRIKENTLSIHETEDGKSFGISDRRRILATDVEGFEPASDSLKGKRKPLVAVERGTENLVNPHGSIPTKDRWYLSVLKKLGCETAVTKWAGTESESIVRVPTPSTLSKKLDAIGLKHKLIRKSNAKGYTPVEEYVKAFSEASYPIGLSNIVEYLHDIEDDHLAGLIGAGGQRVLDALQPLALVAINSNDKDTITKAGEAIDTVTTYIRTLFSNSANNAFGASVDAGVENIFAQSAKSLGIDYTAGAFTAEILEGILETGRGLGWSEAVIQNGQKRINELKQPVLASA